MGCFVRFLLGVHVQRMITALRLCVCVGGDESQPIIGSGPLSEALHQKPPEPRERIAISRGGTTDLLFPCLRVVLASHLGSRPTDSSQPTW
jgi:hypothetical protein